MAEDTKDAGVPHELDECFQFKFQLFQKFLHVFVDPSVTPLVLKITLGNNY